MRLLHYFVLQISMEGQNWSAGGLRKLMDKESAGRPLCLCIISPSFSVKLAPPLLKVVVAFVHAYFYPGYYRNTPTVDTFLDPEL